jgi:hypothetical protein
MSWLSEFVKSIGASHLLPKDADRIGDIEKKLAAKLLPGVLHAISTSSLARASDAALTVLHNAEIKGETVVANVQTALDHAISGSLGLVSPSLSQHVTDAIGLIVTSGEHWAEANAAGIVVKLIAQIAVKLGLGL